VPWSVSSLPSCTKCVYKIKNTIGHQPCRFIFQRVGFCPLCEIINHHTDVAWHVFAEVDYVLFVPIVFQSESNLVTSCFDTQTASDVSTQVVSFSQKDSTTVCSDQTLYEKVSHLIVELNSAAFARTAQCFLEFLTSAVTPTTTDAFDRRSPVNRVACWTVTPASLMQKNRALR